MDKDNRIIESLQHMVRFKTVSHEDTTKEDAKAFQGFRAYLEARYPLVNERAPMQRIGDKGVVFEIKGKTDDNPVVLMSHYDVVPENGVWEHPPFEGKLVDGRLVGRGTLDTKGTLACVMEALEHLLQEGYAFKRTVFAAFSGDEETRGPSAPAIVEHLKKRGVKPGLVLDEGGAVMDDLVPKQRLPVAVVGIAEKGYANLTIRSTLGAGHASMPPKHTAVVEVAKAINALDKGMLFKPKLTGATSMMFQALSTVTEAKRVKRAFARPALYFPFIRHHAIQEGGRLLSFLHTTMAFTQLAGSDALNVLPAEATAGVNVRILPGETVEEVVAKVKARVSRFHVEVTSNKGADPTPTSRVDATFDAVSDVINDVFGEVKVVPYLMMAGTDARYHHDISEHVYRFSPYRFTERDWASIHAANEAIRLDELMRAFRFYKALIRRVA